MKGDYNDHSLQGILLASDFGPASVSSSEK